MLFLDGHPTLSVERRDLSCRSRSQAGLSEVGVTCLGTLRSEVSPNCEVPENEVFTSFEFRDALTSGRFLVVTGEVDGCG